MTEDRTRSPQSSVPPDDPRRHLTVARPDEDQSLRHIGLVGDTYTILVTTPSSTCTSRRAAAPLHTATTLKKCSLSSTVRLSSVFEARASSPGRAKLSMSRLTHFTASGTLLARQRGFYACALRPGRRSSSSPWVHP